MVELDKKRGKEKEKKREKRRRRKREGPRVTSQALRA
jgi:hypothetical protein